jgi:hypothetical protein
VSCRRTLSSNHLRTENESCNGWFHFAPPWFTCRIPDDISDNIEIDQDRQKVLPLVLEPIRVAVETALASYSNMKCPMTLRRERANLVRAVHNEDSSTNTIA